MKWRVSSPVLPSVMRVRVHLPPCCNSPGMHLGQGDDRTPNGVISGAPARFSPASVFGGTPSAWWRSIPTRPAAEWCSPRRHVSSAVFRSIGMSPSFPHPRMVPLTDEMLSMVSSWSFRSSRHPWRNVFIVAGILTPLLRPHHVMGR